RAGRCTVAWWRTIARRATIAERLAIVEARSAGPAGRPAQAFFTKPRGRPADIPRMIDWMFRPQCAACGSAAATLCDACRASLVELGPACPRCAEPTGERAATCARCAADPPPLDGVAAPWRFGGQLASAIRRLKF